MDSGTDFQGCREQGSRKAKFSPLGVLKAEAKLTPKELRDNMVSHQLKEQTCRDNYRPEASDNLSLNWFLRCIQEGEKDWGTKGKGEAIKTKYNRFFFIFFLGQMNCKSGTSKWYLKGKFKWAGCFRHPYIPRSCNCSVIALHFLQICITVLVLVES